MTLLENIRSRVWTGHDIALGSARATIGLHMPLISDDARTRTIKSAGGQFSRLSLACRKEWN